jgi:hypothetical protein
MPDKGVIKDNSQIIVPIITGYSIGGMTLESSGIGRYEKGHK